MSEGQLERAVPWFSQSALLSREIGDALALSHALGNLGVVRTRQGRWDEAIDLCLSGLEVSRKHGDRRGEAEGLCNLSFTHLRRGSYVEAEQCALDAYATFRELKDDYNAGLALGNIGKIHFALGRYDDAASAQKESVAVLLECGAAHEAAEALGNLGNAYKELGDLGRALECFEGALTAFEQDSDPRFRAGVLLNLGRLQDDEAAARNFRTARELFHRSEDKHGEGIALLNCGVVEVRSNDERLRTLGRSNLRAAYDMLSEIGAPEATYAWELISAFP